MSASPTPESSSLPPSQPLGKASYDLLSKPPTPINVVDMQREMQKSVGAQIEEIIDSHRDYADSYYIVYMLQRERLISNAIRQRFIVRKTRPRPDYDTSLFSYDNRSGELTYHWSVPDEETCSYLLITKTSLSPEEKLLLTFVEKFSDGSLV